MKIVKIRIINYKLFGDRIIKLNEGINIFVGENESGKSTILEAINIVTSGKLNYISFEKQLNLNLFNIHARYKYIEDVEKHPADAVPPPIIIEVYCKNDEAFSDYKGTNNTLGEDCPGISVVVGINKEYSKDYKKMLADGEIYDIPLELYTVQYRSFKGDAVHFRFSPFKNSFIDTSKKDYSNLVNRFISENISTYLTDKEKIDLCGAYRKNQNSFKTNEVVAKLNENLETNVQLTNKKVNINLKESNMDAWKDEMSISVDRIPFENIGFGSQNAIKVELVLKNDIEETNIILIEEPETNLSYGNMSKLVAKIEQNTDKQIFISTHSSFVANKLGLKNIVLVVNGEVTSLSQLEKETMDYFKKLPGYDTLRLVLANEIILVEGPADDLIVQRAYLDIYGILPIEDGIDVIVVDSLAFKRYCDIALLVNKKIKILTDNDKDIKTNIILKYGDYLDKRNIEMYYEKDESLYTLEVCVLAENKKSTEKFSIFKKAISKNDSMTSKTEEEIQSFMLNNKTEWSMRVFDYEEKIQYPQYILNAIKK